VPLSGVGDGGSRGVLLATSGTRGCMCRGSSPCALFGEAPRRNTVVLQSPTYVSSTTSVTVMYVCIPKPRSTNLTAMAFILPLLSPSPTRLPQNDHTCIPLHSTNPPLCMHLRAHSDCPETDATQRAGRSGFHQSCRGPSNVDRPPQVGAPPNLITQREPNWILDSFFWWF
jgi:hypothetical protein